MEETYEILKGTQVAHREPTPASAEDYAKFLIRCATRSMTERVNLANQFGWESDEVKDEIFYMDYQVKRAQILFPDLSAKISKDAKHLIVPEVDRAEVNFTKLIGLAVSEPSLTLSELTSFLTQLSSVSQTVDLTLTDTRGQEAEE